MCQAELNVSTQDCRHRWYRLVKSCNPEAGTTLATCTRKITLQGMEVRCAFCPFCDNWNADPGDIRLIGSDRTPSIGGISRHSSFGGNTSTTLVQARKDIRSRRGSLARTDSSSSLSGMGGAWVEQLTRAAGEKNRAMNSRIETYLAQLPSWLESGPSNASVRRGSSSDSDTTISERTFVTPTEPRPVTHSATAPAPSHDRPSGVFGRGWAKAKSKRLSRTFFK